MQLLALYILLHAHACQIGFNVSENLYNSAHFPFLDCRRVTSCVAIRAYHFTIIEKVALDDIDEK